MLNLALCALLILTTYARIKKHLLSMGTPELIIEVLKGAMNYLSLQTHQNSLEWQMSSAWATPIIISGITLPLHQRFNRRQPLLFLTVAFFYSLNKLLQYAIWSIGSLLWKPMMLSVSVCLTRLVWLFHTERGSISMSSFEKGRIICVHFLKTGAEEILHKPPETMPIKG